MAAVALPAVAFARDIRRIVVLAPVVDPAVLPTATIDILVSVLSHRFLPEGDTNMDYSEGESLSGCCRR